SRRLELIEEPRDAWRLVNHAVANDERGQPFRAGATQNAEDVVLLNRDTALRDDLREVTLDERRRAKNADGNFGAHRVKGALLRDFLLYSALDPDLGHPRSS